MKFGIDMGHNAPPDVGVTGLRQEDDLTKEVGTKVIQKLKALDYEVVNCTPSDADTVVDSLSQRCNKANSSNVNVYVSIHFNAFNSDVRGTEVFAIGETSRRIAQPVLENVVALGFTSRGVKDGSHLYVLRNTDMPAILVECCFCDNEKDMALYKDKANSEALANAIVKGLTGKIPTPPELPNTLKVQYTLNRLKITDSSGKALVEDGTMGEQTKSAIQKFQSIVNIAQTGIMGNDTWGAVTEILAKPILSPNHAGGPAVRYVEYRLGVKINGVYDPDTVNAVKKFQSQQGLTADGILGPQSWTKLIG